jgi:hypothetical protein
MGIPATIAVEAESAGDSRTMFRLRINGRLVGENLTAAQTHLLVGNVLERIALPNDARVDRHDEVRAPENLESLHGVAFARGRPFGLSGGGVNSRDELLGLHAGLMWAKAVVWRLGFEIAKLPATAKAEAGFGSVQN